MIKGHLANFDLLLEKFYCADSKYDSSNMQMAMAGLRYEYFEIRIWGNIDVVQRKKYDYVGRPTL